MRGRILDDRHCSSMCILVLLKYVCCVFFLFSSAYVIFLSLKSLSG